MQRDGPDPNRSQAAPSMPTLPLSCRGFLRGTAGLARATALGSLPFAARVTDKITVGPIHVGAKDDYGDNQSHAEGAAVVKKIPGVTVVEDEKVPETVDVTKTMEPMINFDGATLLFPTSFGYFDPFILQAAPKYPKARFEHCRGLWTDYDLTTVSSYFGYIGVGVDLNGLPASARCR